MTACNPQSVSDDDTHVDRMPSIAVYLSAQSFFLAAESLERSIESGELSLSFDMPVYYLYAHALELGLKAFLLAKGLSKEELKGHKFGHKLQPLWDACIQNGLQLTKTDVCVQSLIEVLALYAKGFEFRYIEIGFQQRPALIDIKSVMANIMSAVKPHCDMHVCRFDRDTPVPS